jgi:hypothetical protein
MQSAKAGGEKWLQLSDEVSYDVLEMGVGRII